MDIYNKIFNEDEEEMGIVTCYLPKKRNNDVDLYDHLIALFTQLIEACLMCDRRFSVPTFHEIVEKLRFKTVTPPALIPIAHVLKKRKILQSNHDIVTLMEPSMGKRFMGLFKRSFLDDTCYFINIIEKYALEFINKHSEIFSPEPFVTLSEFYEKFPLHDRNSDIFFRYLHHKKYAQVVRNHNGDIIGLCSMEFQNVKFASVLLSIKEQRIQCEVRLEGLKQRWVQLNKKSRKVLLRPIFNLNKLIANLSYTEEQLLFTNTTRNLTSLFQQTASVLSAGIEKHEELEDAMEDVKDALGDMPTIRDDFWDNIEIDDDMAALQAEIDNSTVSTDIMNKIDHIRVNTRSPRVVPPSPKAKIIETVEPFVDKRASKRELVAE
ncbi:hypothetical protein PCE1_001170 [Barthelona sp. PCE]